VAAVFWLFGGEHVVLKGVVVVLSPTVADFFLMNFFLFLYSLFSIHIVSVA